MILERCSSNNRTQNHPFLIQSTMNELKMNIWIFTPSLSLILSSIFPLFYSCVQKGRSSRYFKVLLQKPIEILLFCGRPCFFSSLFIFAKMHLMPSWLLAPTLLLALLPPSGQFSKVFLQKTFLLRAKEIRIRAKCCFTADEHCRIFPVLIITIFLSTEGVSINIVLKKKINIL